jgi:BirA family transcriptional regulator, biotin operon repressor / biotin---[acetyl-CoA-carboxylase] ligase
MKPYVYGVLRQLADGEFHSGTALAGSLGVSRASVWNAVRELESSGLDVCKVHGRGYRLPAQLSLLDRFLVERELGRAASRFALELVEVAPSTNTLLLHRAAAGAVTGTVIAAEWQSAGRGRRGRAWHGGLGGALAFSMLWRFAQGAGVLSGLSLVVGVALARGLNAITGLSAGLKWPNDVVVDGKKLGGILIEVSGDVLGPSAAVIGIGLNVRLSQSLRLAIDQPVTDIESLVGKRIDRNVLLARLLLELDSAITSFARHGFAPFHAEWERLHAHQGRRVTLLLPDGRSERGTVRGVAEDGALLLEARGDLKRFHSGDISLRAK